MTGVDRPTRVRSGGPWFTRPVAWLLAVGVALGSAPVPAAQQPAPPGGAAPAPPRPGSASARGPAGARDVSDRRRRARARRRPLRRRRGAGGRPARQRRARSSWPAPMPPAAGCRRRASASRPTSPRRPPATRRSSSGSCSATWGVARTPPRCGRPSSPTAPTSGRRTRSFAKAGRSPRSISRGAPAPRSRRPPPRRTNDPRVPTAWAELFLDKHNAKEAAETFETALQADPRWVPALVGYAAAWPTTIRGAARASLDKALAINPASVAAHLWLAEQALDGRRLADAGEEIAKALAVNPDQRRGAVAAGGDRGHRGPHRGRRAAGAARADAAAGLGRRLSHHRRPARRPLSLRGGGRAGAQGRRDRSDRSARPGRARHAPAAHRRRGRRAHGARRGVPAATPSTSSPTTRCRCSTRSTASRRSPTAT